MIKNDDLCGTITINDLACKLYELDIIKDKCKVIKDGVVIYNDRMEFLRYAESSLPFTSEAIVSFNMNYVNGDYESIIII